MRRSSGRAPCQRIPHLSIATLRISEGFAAVSKNPQLRSTLGNAPEYAATDETPLRIAVWGDFSGREGRIAAMLTSCALSAGER